MIRNGLMVCAMAGALSAASMARAADEAEGGNADTLSRRSATDADAPRRISAQPLVGSSDASDAKQKPAAKSAPAIVLGATPTYDQPGTPPLEAFLLGDPPVTTVQASPDSIIRTDLLADDAASDDGDSAIFRSIFRTDDGGIVRDYRIDPPFTDRGSRRLVITPNGTAVANTGSGVYRIVAVPTYSSSTFIGNSNGYFASQTVSYNPGTFVIYGGSGLRYRIGQPPVMVAPSPFVFTLTPCVVAPRPVIAAPAQSGVWVQLRF